MVAEPQFPSYTAGDGRTKGKSSRACFPLMPTTLTVNSISINNCGVGLNMSNGGRLAQSVGSVTMLDSEFSNTPIAIVTAHDATSQPPTAGSLILENIKLSNVSTAVQGPNGAVALTGSKATTVISGWGEGHSYTPTGPHQFEGAISPNRRPASLLQADGKYYERSKPQYEQYPVGDFLSARTLGAKGDGHTDDTKALQRAILAAQAQQKILYLDHGDYLVSGTIYIPAGSKIVGETYPVILSTGKFFNDLNNPKPVVQIGKPGERGSIEWSDAIVSTQGQQRGAVLFEYNLQSPTSSPSGLWDVHSRVGGFAGSQLQLPQCPTTPNITVTAENLDQNCIAAFLTMHITKSSTGLYLENVWLWTADHDVEDPLETQITVYAGRGLLSESAAGPVWLVGTAIEHHTLYQYQFVGSKNVFAGQVRYHLPIRTRSSTNKPRSKRRLRTTSPTLPLPYHSHSTPASAIPCSHRTPLLVVYPTLTPGVFESSTQPISSSTVLDSIPSSTTIARHARMPGMARSARTASSSSTLLVRGYPCTT